MADGYPNSIPLLAKSFHAVSMQHALSQGFASVYSEASNNGVSIDLKTESEGQKAINKMIESAIASLDRSPSIKSLLAKNSWTMQDRQTWEISIANITRDMVHDEPRFGTYRLERQKPMSPISLTAITKDTNFHCEPMAALMGVMLQKVENHFLQPSDDKSNLKRRTDYYLTGGILYQSAFQKQISPKLHRKSVSDGELLHGFVVSPITANYFEGTQGRPAGWHQAADSPYRRNEIKGYKFEDYLAGFPTLADSRGFSVGYDGSEQAQKTAAQRKEAILKGEYEKLPDLRLEIGSAREFAFADERNLLRTLSTCKLDSAPASSRALDDIKYIEDAMQDSKEGEKGRSYKQLGCDADTIDFAMSDREMDKASQGNRLKVFLDNKNYIATLMRYGVNAVSNNKEWAELELAQYLEAKGVNDVWVQRPILENHGFDVDHNFDAVVRTYYNKLPKDNVTIQTPKGPQPMPFHAYLEICKDEYLKRGGKLESIDTPGTLVPTLFNPERRYEIQMNLNGRTMDDYMADEMAVNAHTIARITNKPGTKDDAIALEAVAVVNGNYLTYTVNPMPIAIHDQAGELPTPLSTPAPNTNTAARGNVRPQ